MLNVHRMRVLREVARCGSIAGAADALALTPSAASQHVAMLERETGVALLERGPRSVRLTEAGRVLAAHADDVLGRLASAEASIRAIAGLATGALKLGSFATVGATMLAQAISEFRCHHPGVTLSHVEGEPDTLLPMLVGGEVDLALIYRYDTDDPAPAAGIVFAPLSDDPVLVAVPVDHPLAGAEAITIARLADDAWIAGSDTTWCARFTERVCRRAGFEPRITFRTDDYAVACALVDAGVGVAFLPRLAVRGKAASVAIRPIAGEAHVRRIHVTHRTGTEKIPAAAAMLEHLHHAAAAYELPAVTADIRPAP
jgi:DNA-binding transcriptional LysR family regulator